MKLKTFPTLSPVVKLGDVSQEFAKEEGEGVPEDERVFVVVRQATEQDHMRRAGLAAERKIQYGVQGSALVTSEIVEDNPRQRMMYEAYWTLVEVGNLTDEEGKSLFPKKPIHEMKFEEFQAIWLKLPVYITQALHKVVRMYNPLWDWERPGEA